VKVRRIGMRKVKEDEMRRDDKEGQGRKGGKLRGSII
jgi:hypothetical protein